jgi:hypothetical protein
MSDRLMLLAQAAMVLFASCRIPVGPATAAVATDFAFKPEAFDSFAGVTLAHYTLSQPARTSLYVFSLSAEGKQALVMTLFENLFETTGSHEHMWLGDTNEGTFAPSGRYVGVLQTASEHYETIVRVYHR